MSIESKQKSPELYVEKSGKWRRINMEDDMSFVDVLAPVQDEEPTSIDSDLNDYNTLYGLLKRYTKELDESVLSLQEKKDIRTKADDEGVRDFYKSVLRYLHPFPLAHILNLNYHGTLEEFSVKVLEGFGHTPDNLPFKDYYCVLGAMYASHKSHKRVINDLKHRQYNSLSQVGQLIIDFFRTNIPIRDNYYEFIGYRTRLQNDKYKNLTIPKSNYQPLLKECKTLEEFATIFYLRKHDPNKLEQIFKIIDNKEALESQLAAEYELRRQYSNKQANRACIRECL